MFDVIESTRGFFHVVLKDKTVIFDVILILQLFGVRNLCKLIKCLRETHIFSENDGEKESWTHSQMLAERILSTFKFKMFR